MAVIKIDTPTDDSCKIVCFEQHDYREDIMELEIIEWVEDSLTVKTGIISVPVREFVYQRSRFKGRALVSIYQLWMRGRDIGSVCMNS